MGIPKLVECSLSDWPILPVGIHKANFTMIKDRFATNSRRFLLFEGLLKAAKALSDCGCMYLYLNGSYVTGKVDPDDYDVCWEPIGVDHTMLSSNFYDVRMQKSMYLEEFYPTTTKSKFDNRTMLELFQVTRPHVPTGVRVSKGIIGVYLPGDSMLKEVLE